MASIMEVVFFHLLSEPLQIMLIFCGTSGHVVCLFTITSAMVIYVSKLPLGACSIRACSISKFGKWIGC